MTSPAMALLTASFLIAGCAGQTVSTWEEEVVEEDISAPPEPAPETPETKEAPPVSEYAAASTAHRAGTGTSDLQLGRSSIGGSSEKRRERPPE